MQCKSCGAQLEPDSQFCTNCGVKVQVGNDAPQELNRASSSLGLARCEIKVTEAKGEGPDNDGDVNISIKYEVTNKTDEDWEYLVVRRQLLNSNGQIIDEARDTFEQTVTAGEEVELETYFGSIKLQALGEHPEKARVQMSLMACDVAFQKLDECDVPVAAFDVVPLKPAKIGNVLQLVSGSLWKTEPDGDEETVLNVKALVQNLTAMHLPEVRVIAEVTDKVGRSVTDAGAYEEVRAGDGCLVGGYGQAKDKQLKGARVALSLRAYFPVATGLSQQHVGIEINEPEENSAVEESDGSSTDEGRGSLSLETIANIFYSYEDILQEKGVLVGIAPKNMVGVQLQPEIYEDGGEEKIKCTIVIEVIGEISNLDEGKAEKISDAVSDYLRERGVMSDLQNAGIDSDLLDWFPVKFQKVG